MRRALQWLAHNLIGHPALGVLHFAADLSLFCGDYGLAVKLYAAGDAVHGWTCPTPDEAA